MLRRYDVLRIKNGFLWALNIVLINCLPINVLATTVDSYTQWITPDNVKTFQELVKTKPALYSNLIKPLTIDTAPINLINQSMISLPQYINYLFENNVNYTYSTIQNNAMFRVSDFKKNVGFSGVVFSQEADFTWSNFEGIATFTTTQYQKSAYFFMCKFLGQTYFDKSIFFKAANFRAAQFMNDTDFKESIFHDTGDFERSVFNKNAIFSDVQFDKNANFKKTVFKGLAAFTNAYFGEVADFSQSEFLGSSSFNGVTLPAYLDLSEVNIKTNIDLSTVLPNPNGLTKLNLLYTDASKIKVHYYHRFKLYFPKDAPEGDIAFVYLSLLESLKKNGFDEGYHQLFIEYSEYKYLKHHHYILNVLDKYWWDYGFDKSRIFFWIIVIISFFTIINDLFYERLLKNVYHIPYLNNYLNKSIEKNFFARFIHNLPYAFLYTITLFFGKLIGFKIDAREFKSKNYFANLYLYLIIIMGLTCAFFAFNSIFKATPTPSNF